MLEFHRHRHASPPPETDMTPARLRAIADRLERQLVAGDANDLTREVRRAVPTIRDLAVEAEIANRHLGSAS